MTPGESTRNFYRRQGELKALRDIGFELIEVYFDLRQSDLESAEQLEPILSKIQERKKKLERMSPAR